MTTDTRSPHEIERDIEQDRAELTENLETLQDRFSMDGVMRSVGDQLREHGGEIGTSISRTVKENPTAVILTGIGLAWMIFGNKSERHGRRSPGHASVQGCNDARHDDLDIRSAVSRPDPRFKGGQTGVPNWMAVDEDDDERFADRASDLAASAHDGISGAASSAHDGTADTVSSARDGVARAGSAVSSKAPAAGSVVSGAASKAAKSAGSMTRTAQERAARLKERLAEGTETLSEEAKARVIAAHDAAIDARRRAVQAASSSAERASNFYDSQPLVVGALAVAVGAAIGGALPRTEKEDDLMGARSDELMQRAERIFQDEREKAKAVLDATKDKAKTIAEEKRDDLDRGAPADKTAAEAVTDEVKAAGKRVVDTAEAKADEKGLGKIKS